MTPAYSEPDEHDLKLLADRWAAIASLALEQFEIQIDESLATLDVLQQIVDGELVNHGGLLAVGVALGRVMVNNIEGLDWWAVVDENGRQMCLRYEKTDFRVKPISSISIRIARNEPVNFSEIFRQALTEVERLGNATN